MGGEELQPCSEPTVPKPSRSQRLGAELAAGMKWRVGTFAVLLSGSPHFRNPESLTMMTSPVFKASPGDQRQSRKHWSVRALTAAGSESLARDHRLWGWLGSAQIQGPAWAPRPSSLTIGIHGRCPFLINSLHSVFGACPHELPLPACPGLETNIIATF